MHVPRLELRLLFYRHALIAPVLNENVGSVTISAVVSIHGDGSLDVAFNEPALVIGAALDCATASVLPEREHIERGVALPRTEIGMPPKTGPAHLRQHPSVLEQAVTRGWQL